MIKPWIDVYEHPDYGTVRVFWHYEDGYHGLVPALSYQTDMFTPDGEVEHLRGWILSVRIDRSISVSAVSPTLEA